MMSQAPQDLDDGETRHDNRKLKLTNVKECSGRSTHQGATRKLNSQSLRVEEVCLKNACLTDVHMTHDNHDYDHDNDHLHDTTTRVGALVAHHPGRVISPFFVPAGTPTVHWGRYDGRPWVARHQRHKWQSQGEMTHHPDSTTHMSSDKHGSGAGYHQQR